MGPLSPTRAFLPGVTLAAAYGLLIYALGVSSAMAAVFSVVTVAGTEGELKTLPRFVRFTIPRDSTESLTDRWVVFTHHLSVAKTADNPLGRAWTYAHAPDAMFRGISGVR